MSQAQVVTCMSMSLDGFIGRNDAGGWDVHNRLHGWKFPLAIFREHIGEAGGAETASTAVLAEDFEESGAYVMGMRMFESGVEPWGETPPFHAPVFVLTHRAREPLLRQGGTTFHFVTDGIESAVGQARAVSGGKRVFISGGASAIQQTIGAGLLDQLRIDLAPVLLGEGVRLFDNLGIQNVELEATQVIAAEGVTHLTYRLRK